MSRTLFRIYTCPKCGYDGYVAIGRETDISPCSLCWQNIGHQDTITYADTLDEARRIVTQHETQTPVAEEGGV